jgi:hypothetical protein
MHSLCLCSNMMIVAMQCLLVATVDYGPLVQRCIILVMDTNHGGGTLLWNHKKKPFSSVAKKKKDLFMGGRQRKGEREKDCLFPCNDKLLNPLRSLMIKYKIL